MKNWWILGFLYPCSVLWPKVFLIFDFFFCCAESLCGCTWKRKTSLVVASGDSLGCARMLPLWLLITVALLLGGIGAPLGSTYGHHCIMAGCNIQVQVSCETQVCPLWHVDQHLPGPGIIIISTTLADGFLLSVLPEKSLKSFRLFHLLGNLSCIKGHGVNSFPEFWWQNAKPFEYWAVTGLLTFHYGPG